MCDVYPRYYSLEKGAITLVIKNKAAEKKGKVKVGKLNINKETVKDLTTSDKKGVRAGAIPREPTARCITVNLTICQ